VTRIDPAWVVARLALPGWTANINGKTFKPNASPEGLLAVRVPPNEAVGIEWSYFPPGLFEGSLISALTAAALLAMMAVNRTATRPAGRNLRQAP